MLEFEEPNHFCDDYGCKADADECYCYKHLETLKEEAAEEGYKKGYIDAEIKYATRET